MKVKRSADEFLNDIVVWSARALSHIEGMTQPEFLESNLVQDACAKCIENIGEAASRAIKLDPQLRKEHPHLDTDIAYQTRNALAHGYHDINYDILWDTVTIYAPRFAKEVTVILAQRKADTAR